MNMRFYIALWISKIYSAISRVILKRGSSAPGAIALRLYPLILKELSGRVRGKTIVVCGTNGKTTTNNLLYAILKAKGMKVVCNNAGANMLNGIITAYINGCGAFGKIDADYVCIEVDEATATKAFDSIRPDYMVITNFFRDQLDRYGEIDLTVDWLKKAVGKAPEAVLILNGDDPICGGFYREAENKRIFFGIDERMPTAAALRETKEGRYCAFCRHELKYNFYIYSQLGDYYCESCGFGRPLLDISASGIKVGNSIEFTVSGSALAGGEPMRDGKGKGQGAGSFSESASGVQSAPSGVENSYDIRTDLMGVHNIYNIMAAMAVVSLLGTDMGNINEILSAYKPQSGRMEEFAIRGMPVILNLSKNPAGFNQAISDMLRDPRDKDVVIVINDNAPDGTDVSWLWDVDFEELGAGCFSRFAISGIRAEDMFLRMKYAGIAEDSVLFEKDIKSAIDAMLAGKNEVLYVLVNYSPLVEARKVLLKLGK